MGLTAGYHGQQSIMIDSETNAVKAIWLKTCILSVSDGCNGNACKLMAASHKKSAFCIWCWKVQNKKALFGMN